jgi:hypothetical protein
VQWQRRVESHLTLVIPAKAGIQFAPKWTPAFAGVTTIRSFLRKKESTGVDPRLRGGDHDPVIPAEAGIHRRGHPLPRLRGRQTPAYAVLTTPFVALGGAKRGWRRLRSLESAISRRDQGGSRGVSSQPSAKGASGRSQTLKDNVCASPPLRRAQFPRRGFIK